MSGEVEAPITNEQIKKQAADIVKEIEVQQIPVDVEIKPTTPLQHAIDHDDLIHNRDKMPASKYVTHIKNQTKNQQSAFRESVIVDLESESLSYPEARAIRLNIEQDVQ